MSAKILLASVLLAMTAACGSNQASAGASDEAPRVVNRDRSVITQAELDADASLKAQSVLDVIRSLRPQFLTNRGTQTVKDSNVVAKGMATQDPEAGYVHASIDGGRVVPLSELADMHGNQVLEIRYLNAAQAMQKFGMASRQGPIILVVTQKM